MNLHLVLLIIICLANFILGILAWIVGKKNKANRFFLILVFISILWITALYFSDLTNTIFFGIFWNRLTLVAGILFAYFFFLFCLAFAKKDPSNYFVFLVVPLILVILNTPLVVKNIEFYKGGTNLVVGPLYFLVVLFYIIFPLLGLWILFLRYKKSKSVERLQIQYLLIGFTLSAFGILVTNVMLPLFTKTYFYAKFGPYFTVFFILFTTFSITRYHLFGIEVILTEILIVAIGILLILQIFGTQTILWRAINGTVFVLFSVGGWLLIRYTLREIKRREEAERLSQAKTEFLSIVSHQLRTPLTAIKGYLSMILEGTYGKVSATTQKPIENIYASNERLIRLVNDFLQVSRLETGKIDVEFKKTNLERLIQDIVDELWIKAKAKKLYLKFEKPKEQVPEILADKDKIRQVVLNLIDNAIRYTNAGGINISLEKTKNYVRIIVKDSGEGLEKEEAERLFKSFSRGAAGQKMWTEGAGLGLYIAKKLVELHKGKIWATSEGKQKGSTFYVELPIQ